MASKRSVAVFFAALLVVGVALAFILGVGIFADDGSSSGGSGDGGASTSPEENGTQQTDAFDDIETLEDLENETLEAVEDRYTGPGRSTGGFFPVTEETEMPPGTTGGPDPHLQIDALERNTIETVSKQDFLINFDTNGEDIYNHPQEYSATYDHDVPAAQRSEIYTGGIVNRFYSTATGAMHQTITPADITNESRPPISGEEMLSFQVIRPYLETGWYEPVNYTVFNNYQITVYQSQFLDDPSPLVDHIDPAVEIVQYGGEVHVDEFGNLLSADVTVLYRTREGEEYARTIHAGMHYGDVDLDPPSWADDQYLQGVDTTVELVDSQYLKVRTAEAVPEGATLELTTPTDQFTTELQAFDAGSTFYIAVDGQRNIQITDDEPSTNEFIGPDYSLIIINDGNVIVSDS